MRKGNRERPWAAMLSERGWYLERACNCNGTYREEWRKTGLEGWEIILLPDGNSMKGPSFKITFYRKSRMSKPLRELEPTVATYEGFN